MTRQSRGALALEGAAVGAALAVCEGTAVAVAVAPVRSTLGDADTGAVVCPEPLGAFYVYPSVKGLIGVPLRGRTAANSSELADIVLDEVVKGDTVKEVLDYVEFDVERLTKHLRTDVEAAVRDGRIDLEQSGRLLRFYEEGLQGYTYLEEPRHP